MGTTLLKPRWEHWENACVQSAFQQRIQHKIMATALGRTASAVSKKIKALGLRLPSATQGQPLTLTKAKRAPQDQAKMIAILQTYAPFKCFQIGHLALKEACWTQSKPIMDDKEDTETCLESIECNNVPYVFVKPLTFTPVHTPLFKERGVKKFSSDPDYVPLCYIEQWASSAGFHKIKGTLQKRGISYWKDGRYFSQNQLLMHVNRLRFEHHLQPIALEEDEEIA